MATIVALAACGSDPTPPPAGGSPFCVTNCSPPGTAPVTTADASVPPVTVLTLLLDAPRVTVAQKASADVGITVARPAGMVEAVALEVTNLPLGASAATLIVPHDQSRASFRLTMGANTPQGPYEFDVTIRGTTQTASAKMSVDVVGAAGVVDPTFGPAGGGGRALAPASDIYAMGMGRQPDGALVVGGSMGAAPARDFAAVRFNADGILDPAFGSAGKAVFDFGVDDFMYGLVIQPDGKIVTCGYRDVTGVNQSILFGRWLADGKPDTTFGNSTTPDGKFLATPSTYNVCYGVSLQGDGKILGAGSFYSATPDYNFAIYRLTSTGALDTTFGAPNGYAQIDIGNHEYAFAVTADTQGRLVATGEKFNGTSYDLMTARFSSVGAPDVTFAGGPSGWVSSVAGAPSDEAYGWSTLELPDGKILISGTGPGVGRDFMFVRYDTAGVLDPSFGTGGKTLVNASAVDRLMKVKIDAQGRIVFCGYTSEKPAGSVARGIVGRLSADGVLDQSFGNAGLVTLDFSTDNQDTTHGIEFQTDGRILIGGSSIVAGKHEPWVVRLWP